MARQKPQKRPQKRPNRPLDDHDYAQIEQLAAIGTSRLDIERITGIARKTMYAGKARDAYERGWSKFRAKIASQVQKLAFDQKEPSEQMLKLLVEKTGAFVNDAEGGEAPQTARDAKALAGRVIARLEEGTLPESRATAVLRALESFVKLAATADIEQRLEEIEKRLGDD